MAQYTSTHTGAEIDSAVTSVTNNAATWTAKQDALVSGTNIKTVNDKSLLGSGNIKIAASLTDLGITATAAELNTLDGITASTTELNYTDGVTSNIQTQLNGKQASLSTQTAYTSKGSATKVPQITTNTLGQVTGINEVTITQPTVNNATLTIKKNGTNVQTFTANQATDATANITIALSDVGVTATAAELNTLDGITASTAELNYTDGVTSNIQTQLNGKLSTSLKGAASGLAELGSDGKVPSSQLPSYVDDVVEGYYYNGKFYSDKAHTTEITGESGKIYVDLSTNKTYRYSGSTFVEISSSLALGETSSTAYRGDRGKTAYDHSQLTSGNPHNVSLTDLGVSATATELNYVDGVTSNIQTQLNAKQATLVSGTNIKTINNNSILGSGNLTLDSGKVDDVQANGTSIVSNKIVNLVFNTTYDPENNKIATVADLERQMPLPTISQTSFTYTGSEQGPTVSYNERGCTLSGTTKATNAGSYTVTLTLKSGYVWTDLTSEAKSFTWTIAKASCDLTLSKSTIALDTTTQSDTFTITKSGDGTISVTSSDTSIATASLSGTTVTVAAAGTTGGSSTITVNVTEGTNHLAGTATCIATATYLPSKGDLITMTLGTTAAAGTNNTYRVLKVDGTQAEVVAMYDYNTSTAFSSSSRAYSGSTLDTLLNTTFYNSLNDTAKAAIVDKDITQYKYNYKSSVYNSSTHASYADYSTKATYATVGSRHVYALDVEDIETYFNSTFSTANIWTLFWNTTSQPSNCTYPWLRSAITDYSSLVYCVFGDYGCVDGNYYDNLSAARPAFTIDLTKVDWSKS